MKDGGRDEVEEKEEVKNEKEERKEETTEVRNERECVCVWGFTDNKQNRIVGKERTLLLWDNHDECVCCERGKNGIRKFDSLRLSYSLRRSMAFNLLPLVSQIHA